MTVLVIATRNTHKVEEIRSILGDQFIFRDLRSFSGAPNVVEDALSFAGNAVKKSVELAQWLAASGHQERMAVLADDSGLEVDVLNGAPGVHSARFAGLDAGTGGNSPDVQNNTKLLRLLKDVPAGKRTARFRCVLAWTPVIALEATGSSPVCAANEFELVTSTFDGVCEGAIGFEPRGDGGFGYDPLFSPQGERRTFAELGEDVKNRISHRARALQLLKRALIKEPK
jgi:XTP/dITP diphosphohydrolase